VFHRLRAEEAPLGHRLLVVPLPHDGADQPDDPRRQMRETSDVNTVETRAYISSSTSRVETPSNVHHEAEL
jgi:hypothetical protein